MVSLKCGQQISTNTSLPLALYVHVPFCRARCAYCDFNTYAGLEGLMLTYVRALLQEIGAIRRRWGPLRVSTVYVGGGTPSLLPLPLMAELFRAVRAAFDLSPGAEITVEANPGTVDDGYLSGLRDLGVGRLSIGVQSAHDGELGMLDRIHSWYDAVRIVRSARDSGFENLSLDLLFGLPGQSWDRWRETLERALALDPEHLSLYGLMVAEGTPLAERIATGSLPPPDDDRVAAMYELAEETLARAGFFHYEISNWAKADPVSMSPDQLWWPRQDALDPIPEKSESVSPYVCRHNLTYWRNEPWLGVGAGAHSWMTNPLLPSSTRPRDAPVGGERWANPDHPEDYVEAIDRSADPGLLRRDVETIDRRLEMGETMMLGLRLAEGVTIERFDERFDRRLEDVFGEQLMRLRELGLLTWDGTVTRLTRRGRLLGNRVFERFI